MQIIEKFSPSNQWRIETIITLLSIAGDNFAESVPRTAIIFISQSEVYQSIYASV
jgi:hypothetical protein